ncbi:MAG: succinate dehydrogenase/fumarate reductase iron-sulfur subunit [Planctomycetes bacterium]|nr:succinate dehydrogenase/fumarate reductase iron-sulfur subunit [Planctomycetota bacterium]
MNFTLRIWRQKGPASPGDLVTYPMKDVSPDMSLLEMLDGLNERLIAEGQEPIAFESDCREGICGVCGLTINGIPHGRRRSTTTCQLHMRMFEDGEEITIEPFRAGCFPVVKDLVVDRRAFDRIIASGGFISASTGSAPEANSLPVSKKMSDRAMDAAQCIGCGACVASCPNGSAMLFVGAKISHLGLLPQGQPERYDRARKMVAQMDREGFGACTNTGECEAVCPKDISLEFIARMFRDYLRSVFVERPESGAGGGP